MKYYCDACRKAIDTDRCPVCGKTRLHAAEPDDLCFLTEKEQILSGMLADVLKQNEIPFIGENVLGAGVALKVGPMFERVRFYVFFNNLSVAEKIVEELFSKGGENTDDN